MSLVRRHPNGLLMGVCQDVTDWEVDFYVSEDNGITWTPRITSSGIVTEVVDFDILDNGFILLSTMQRSILVSYDEGYSFSPISIGSNSSVYSIVSGPDDTLFALAFDGVYKSIDMGISWLRFNTGLASIYLDGGRLAVRDNELFLFCIQNPYIGIIGAAPESVFVTSLTAPHWSALTNSVPNARFHFDILTSTNGALYYFGDEDGIMKSEDGVSWRKTDFGISTYTFRSFAVTNSGDAVAVSNPGIIRYSAVDDLWSSQHFGNFMAAPQKLYKFSNDTLVASAINTTFVSVDHGNSWIEQEHEKYDLYHTDTAGGLIYGWGMDRNTQKGVFAKSNNFGRDWLSVREFNAGDFGQVLASFTVDPHPNAYLLSLQSSGQFGLIKLDLVSGTQTLLAEALAWSQVSFVSGYLYVMVAWDYNSGLQLYRSEGGSANFELIPTPVIFSGPTFQVMDDGEIFLMSEGGIILRSNDDGASWQDWSIPFQESYNNRVQAITKNNKGLYVAAVDNEGVFYRLSGKLHQEISFDHLDPLTVGQSGQTLVASSSCGLPVTFTSSHDERVSISGNFASGIEAGSISITAHQAGTIFYDAAVDVTQTICVNPAQPEITFNGIELELDAKVFDSVTWMLENEILDISVDSIPSPGGGTYIAIVGMEGCFSKPSMPFVVTETTSEETSIVVYPNPVIGSGRLFVRLPDSDTSAALTLFDSFGKRVMSTFINTNESELDISALTSGIYLLKVRTASRSSVVKLVK